MYTTGKYLPAVTAESLPAASAPGTVPACMPAGLYAGAAISADASETAGAASPARGRGECGLRLRLRGRDAGRFGAAVRPASCPACGLQPVRIFTPNFVLGTSLNCPDTATTAYDNLTGPLAGEFVSIKPCTCDDLEVSGQIYYPIPVCATDSCCAAGPAFTPSAVSVCSLTAVAFTVPASETQDETYTQLKSLLWQALHPGRPPLSNTAPVMKPTPCDCTDSRLSGRRTVSVAAGPLLVANAAVLGSVGEVLVLANDADRRIYYVCQNSVSFSG